MNQDNNKVSPQDDEIDLMEILKPIWDKRKFILKITIIFAIFGLIIALLMPKQYTAKTVITPQSGSRSSGMEGMSGLAAIAGINVNMGSATEISPKLYPQILSSTPFLLELMNAPIQFSKIKKTATLYEYYTQIYKPSVFSLIKKYTVGLPSLIVNAFRGKEPEVVQGTKSTTDKDTPIRLTREQVAVMSATKSLITTNLNEKERYIELSCTMPDELASADLLEAAQLLLQKYIIGFKIKKAKDQHDFIEERYKEAKRRYEQAQTQLAYFRDHNRDLATNLARAQVDQLNGEFNLQYNVYAELAKQLEQAKIQIKEETPVFVVIQPVVVPKEKSKPNRPLIIMTFVFLGLLGSSGFIVGKKYWSNIKNQLQTTTKKE